LKLINTGAKLFQSRLVGGAFDGEYFNLDVPNHLANMMLLNDDQKEWYSYQWDPVFILELAEKDARKYIASVLTLLTTVNEECKFETNFVKGLNIENAKNNVLEYMNDVFDVGRILLLSSDLAHNV